MSREFLEETGININNWHHVLTLRFQYAEIEFFAVCDHTGFMLAKTMTDEQIWKGNPDDEHKYLIENIPYLIGLSKQRITDVENSAPQAVEAVKKGDK